MHEVCPVWSDYFPIGQDEQAVEEVAPVDAGSMKWPMAHGVHVPSPPAVDW